MNSTASHGAGALDGLRVLVVDDGDIDRTLTSEALSAAGARVSHGCDGSEGLALAAQHRFDAIVLDIEMPLLNGFEVARQLRLMGIETRIFAVTSLQIPPEDPRRQKYNVSGWFQKPLDGEQLVSALSLPCGYAIGPQVNPKLDRECADKAFDSERLAGASARVLAVVFRFSNELESMLQDIGNASSRHSVEDLKSQLHRLRGASGSCGFTALMVAVERWEDAIDATGNSDEGVYLIGLRRAAEEGRTAFRQLFDARSDGTQSA